MDARKRKSTIGLLRAARYFTHQGWHVFVPLAEDGPIDFVVCRKSEVKRIQIKAVKPLRGALPVKFRSTNNWQDKAYQKGDFDWLVAYNHISGNGYLLRLEDFVGKKVVYLRLAPARNNQKTRDAQDYQIF